MTPPSVSVWLDKLTERRLIRRSKGDTDGRTQNLQLTDTGTQLTARAHEALLKSEQQFMVALSPGERVLLLEILHKRSQGQFSLDCIWSEPEVYHGQLMWSQHRRMGSFSEFVIEQDRQRVYLYDADAEKERCEREVRDGPLREDFHRYWLREPAA